MRLCHIDEVPDGGSRGFDPLRQGQDSLLLVRQGMRLYAWRDACPHHNTPMAWRKDAYLNATGDRIVCAAHGAQFEIETGLCTLGPCLGQSLTSIALRLEESGEVHIDEKTYKETYP
ncbi:Rieske (2Fe-2S) protein [Curvibacter sp. CHRR-16]|uniref:Rieske (2Fe-2S) protein n=1 Tax=Curvibacter sp. CHRR-16 TaxID=2835872 RepID=UPI001BDA0C82|nr:Rieske (2Fe-2S) protein [Curvibacter sp. CHRR-16]MBT0569739.1 Rieske (2Fe-2S) protein [Curvibacter sp. CHRR-16]